MADPVGYKKEADLCLAFIRCLPHGWTAYPETGGFDILLSRDEDGFQIGVEAKLRLNTKVITQAMEGWSVSYVCEAGPDCRAVLVPESKTGSSGKICGGLGITVIRMSDGMVLDENGEPNWEDAKARKLIHFKTNYGSRITYPFRPALPTLEEGYLHDEDWFERCPQRRLKLPDYVPDVVPGAAAPVALTPWKIKAIKIAVTLEQRGFVTRRDFTHFQISMSRWIDPFDAWLKRDGDGGWIKGDGFPDFAAQHPRNYLEIAAEYESWKSPPAEVQRGLISGKKEKKNG